MPNNQLGYTPTPVPLGTPADCRLGRRSIHVTVDFTLGATFKLDLSQVQSQGAMDSVQTLYIDNSNNTFGLTITLGVSLQNVIIPAGAQGYIPVLQPNPPILIFTTLGGTPLVEIQLMNFFLPPCIWYTNGMPIIDLTLLPLIMNGGLNVNTTPLTLTSPSDGSGTITTGGVPQSLFAIKANRKRLLICNPSTATEVLQFCYGTNTAGRIDLPPGTSWNEADVAVSGDQIWIVAATTSHAFVAYEW